MPISRALFRIPIFFLAVSGSASNPSLQGYEKLKLMGPRPLEYANPAWNRPAQRQFKSLDEALEATALNLRTQRYMRDSFGLSQANVELEVDSAGLLPAARNRIIGWLDASRLRYDLGENRSRDIGYPTGYSFGLGTIADAQAYFRLRDSLISMRSASLRVKVDEVPYSPELDPDSLQWFLRSIRAAKVKDQEEFERYFLRTFFEYRRSASASPVRGIYCSIALKLPASATDIQAAPASLPRWMIPFRNRPMADRMERFEVLAMLGFAAGMTGLVLALSVIAILIRKRRRGKPGLAA